MFSLLSLAKNSPIKEKKKNNYILTLKTQVRQILTSLIK
jgi:hypothetical protein